MANESSTPPGEPTPSQPPPPAKTGARVLGAICSGDLGLKVGYKTGDGPVTFRQIVGWVTVVDWEERSGGEAFVPVVLHDVGFPVYAATMPGYLGTFGVATTPEEALAKHAGWQRANGATSDQGGGPSGGHGQLPN